MFIVSYECKMSLIQQLDDCYHQRGILGQVGGAVGQIGGRRFGPNRGWVLTICQQSWSVRTVAPGAWWASCGVWGLGVLTNCDCC
jgi:hypothetical protein